MQTRELALLQDLVGGEAGMELSRAEVYAVENRLTRLAQAERLRGIPELLNTARAGTSLRQRVCEAVAVHETRFFRDEAMFDALGEHVLPGLIARGRRTLSLWCAAAASGQEAVTTAIVLRERCPHVAAQILATDLSHAMVERGRVGVYTTFEARRGLSPERQARHFEPVDGGLRARPELRAAIEVRQLNLAGPWQMQSSFDVVLLRNVLVYLNASVRDHVLARIRQVLAADGVLVLGSTESMPSDAFQRFTIGTTTFYRPAQEMR